MYDVLYEDNDPCVSLCPQGVHKPHTYRPYHHTLAYIDIEYLRSVTLLLREKETEEMH